LYIYSDIFKAQNECFCKHQWKVPALTYFWPWHNAQILLLWWSSWLRIFPFLLLFDNKFTCTWLHCPTLTKTWWSNLMNLIPDRPRWWMVTVLIFDWPCCSFTSHPGFIFCIFYILIAFWYFRPSGFKTIVFVNHRKTNHHNWGLPVFNSL
jgi:hypothetical protein